MERFLERHQANVVGVLSGFDRVLFRGTLGSLGYINGMSKFLSSRGVLLKDFGRFAERLSAPLKARSQQIAAEAGRPWRYLESPKASKEDIARRIAERDGVQEGLICVLSCVEPCQTYAIRRNRQARRLELVSAQRKCSFLYFYYLDREFGFMHVRLQTWLPFTIQVCLNGREYLARRMDRAGMDYEQRDNCFTRIEDIARAQRMMDDLERRKWSGVLNAWARRVNPWLTDRDLRLFGYYWTMRQGELATDVMFRDAASLRAVYPRLTDHAIRHFGSQEVMRFLGRRTNARFSGEVVSDLRVRQEGVRVKHWVEENSIKMYDKQGSVLRIETTINNPGRFKVRRQVTRRGRRVVAWAALRKGIIDIGRRAEISRAANGRYLEALAVVGVPSVTHHVLDPVSRRVTKDGRPYRPLRPITTEDSSLFRVVLRGEFAIRGFENRDLREYLFSAADSDPATRRRISGRVTRWLRLLRAHRLIRKVPGTRYYRVTDKGQHVMSTALAVRESDVTGQAA